MTDPKRKHGGKRPNQTGRPPAPAERKAQWSKALTLRIPPDVHDAYQAASAAQRAEARNAAIEALRASLMPGDPTP